MGRDDAARVFFGGDAERTAFLAARFRSHRYALHAHDTYVIGGIITGCGALFIRGRQHRAAGGELSLYNPGEVHDGGPGCADGFRYRVAYPSLATLTEVAAELAGRDSAGAPFFRAPFVRDPIGLRLFQSAHRAIERGTDALAGEERLLLAYARFLALHAEVATRPAGAEPRPVARVKALIADQAHETLPLAALAQEAGLSRFHLIRAFQGQTGLTPHAYLVNRRIELAKRELRAGVRPGEVAAATGFADQAHLTRTFKAHVGVTPGAYRAALRP